MDQETVLRDLRGQVAEQVGLMPEGINRYRVLTPFQFDDGDHLAIILRHRARWEMSDEGHTLMHLTYAIAESDLRHGHRGKSIDHTLITYGIENQDGELVMPVPEGRYGDALFTFIQGLLKIADVSYLTRERMRSTFDQDLRAVLVEAVPAGQVTFGWHHRLDLDSKYVVDTQIASGTKPVLVFALPNDDRVRDATITLLQFERWGFAHQAVGVFADQELINRRVLARFTDVCDKQFSSLAPNADRIKQYFSALH